MLRPNDQLRTPSELQEEQERAQAAKLEELLRSGKPDDLKEANKLMKIMAGFKDDTKVAVKQAINNELNKLKRKADLFNEMLTSADEPDLENETIQELYGDLKSAQPKFKKLIEEERDDDALVSNLSKFNDLVIQLLKRYKSIKGMKEEELNVPDTNEPAKELNLIDFDDDTTANTPSVTSPSKPLQPFDDLLGDFNKVSLSSPKSPQENDTVVDILGDGHSKSSGIDLLDFDSQPGESKTALSAYSNSIVLPNGLLNSSSNSKEITAQSQRHILNQSDHLRIDYELTRESMTKLRLVIFYSNISSDPITNFALLVASPKGTTLSLQPQSGNMLQSNSRDGIKQIASIEGISVNLGKPIKLKWKANYCTKGDSKEESGTTTLPTI